MTDKEILRKAVDKAIENGYTGHLRYYPSFIDQIVPENKEEFITDELYENYPTIIFSHSFAKAFWGAGNIKMWWILLCSDIVDKPFSKLINKKIFIKKFNKKIYEETTKILIPNQGIRFEELNKLISEQPKKSFINCFKKKYKKLISYETDNSWEDHLQQMVLKDDSIKYLEKFL